ncbi:hypothetical protein [Rhodobaculum claviforme]|uniref:Type I secretion protein n=1 Tax=Rhodobaculum claviforme TaxID=1549854 RepID=A0A934WJI6_9RHOB|nr:hypothetical protein [Rhodobaculum claviforme]MBK5928096.1 hypothetical protein [Rhodobaculum claviforme]
MALDRITEEIAHFIGMFHLGIEADRLRLEYDAFAASRAETDHTPTETPMPEVSAPYALKGFVPGLSYEHPQAQVPLLPLPTIEVRALMPDVAAPPPPQAPAATDSRAGPVATEGQVTWILPEIAPNSLLIVISQTADLFDNDLVLVTGETPFTDPQVMVAALEHAIELAQHAHAPGHDAADGAVVPRANDMAALAEAMATFAPAAGTHTEAAPHTLLLLRGEAAQGVHISGAQTAPPPDDGAPSDAPALPDFTELLPAFLAARPQSGDTAGEKDAFALPPRALPPPQIAPFGVDPGHTVVTGANTLVNEAVISQSWIDAPVIAVAGDAIRLDLVSQVILRHATSDAAPAQGMGMGMGMAAPSRAINAVEIDIRDAPAPITASTAGGVFPQSWSVTRVEGDLIAVNHVQQFAFVSDFDRVEVTVTAAASYLGTGENTVLNTAVLRELGFHYDLILVGGDMITLNQIHQTNVLLDADTVAGAHHPGVTITAGDNLQYNRAEITQVGRDEMVAMRDTFQSALADMAGGGRDIGPDLARDALFEGRSALKVLQVEGDLIKANIIEQHAYLGDSDQIGLMLEDFLASGQPVEVITGSNAQLNAARLTDFGLDSTVMVAGTAYSDALIHQAQLIDPEAPPTGVGLVPLANEAVAFLADGMTFDARDADPAAPQSLAEHLAGGDGLNAVLS